MIGFEAWALKVLKSSKLHVASFMLQSSLASFRLHKTFYLHNSEWFGKCNVHIDIQLLKYAINFKEENILKPFKNLLMAKFASFYMLPSLLKVMEGGEKFWKRITKWWLHLALHSIYLWWNPPLPLWWLATMVASNYDNGYTPLWCFKSWAKSSWP